MHINKTLRMTLPDINKECDTYECREQIENGDYDELNILVSYFIILKAPIRKFGREKRKKM